MVVLTGGFVLPAEASLHYAFSEVFSAPWGSTDTAVGYLQSFDKNYGPASFYVTPVGDIYVLDNINQKIKSYDTVSGELSSLPMVLPHSMFIDLVVDAANHFYLLDIENNIYEYDATGSLVNRYAVSRQIRLIKGLKLLGDKLYVTTAADWMYLIKEGMGIYPVEQQLHHFIEGIGDDDGKYYTTSCRNGEWGTISEHEQGGMLTREVSIHFPSKNLLTFVMLPGAKDFYCVIAEFSHPDDPFKPTREVQLYSFTGEKLYTINIPFLYYAYSDKEFQIDAAGNIYHLLAQPDGITLVKLIQSETRAPSGRTGGFSYPTDYQTIYHFNDNLLPNPNERASRRITRPTTSAADVTRSEALVIAEDYRDLEWTAIAGNLSGGTVTCGDGHIIRTPSWVTTGAKISVPYKWGGFTSIETYLANTASGKYAGSDYTSDVSWGDAFCVGVDCSGFVSRCWRCGSKYGTSTLPTISSALGGFDEMLTGDIINLVGSHVRLFERKEENGTYSFIEAMGTYWRVMSRNYTAAAIASYTPRRYDNIIELAAPELLGLFNGAGTDITVKWRIPSDTAAININIYIGTDGDSYNVYDTAAATAGSLTLSGLADGATYYCNATFANSSNREGLYSNDYIFRVRDIGNPEVLLVDDESRFAPHSIAPFHGLALSDCDLYYDICSSAAVAGDTVTLSDYWAVVWFTGRGSSTGSDTSLNTSERARLQNYLDTSGNLFISGQEIAYDLDNKGIDAAFLTNYLKGDYAADDAGNDVLLTGTNGSLLNGMSFELDEDNGLIDDGGAYDARWPDVIRAADGGETICTYSTNKAGGISHKGVFGGTDSATLVYLAFSFECIKNSSDRNAVMRQVMDYFVVPGQDTSPAITITTSYTKEPGTVFSFELTAVDNSDTATGLFWSLSDTDPGIWNSLTIVEGDTDYLMLDPAGGFGTDTFTIIVQDGDSL